MNPFNKYLMSILKSTRELYGASEFWYPKGVVIIIIIDKVISPNEKLIKTTEEELTFDVTKESPYDNPMNLLLSRR